MKADYLSDEEELQRRGLFDDGVANNEATDDKGLNLNSQNFDSRDKTASRIDQMLRARERGAGVVGTTREESRGKAAAQNERDQRSRTNSESDTGELFEAKANELDPGLKHFSDASVHAENDETNDLDIDKFLPRKEADGARDAAVGGGARVFGRGAEGENFGRQRRFEGERKQFEITPTMPPGEIFRATRPENVANTAANTEMVTGYVDNRGNELDAEMAQKLINAERADRKAAATGEVAKIGSELNKQGVDDVDEIIDDFEESGDAAGFYARVRGGNGIEGKVEKVLKASFDNRVNGIGETA